MADNPQLDIGALQEMVWKHFLCPWHGPQRRFDPECSTECCQRGLAALIEAAELGRAIGRQERADA